MPVNPEPCALGTMALEGCGCLWSGSVISIEGSDNSKGRRGHTGVEENGRGKDERRREGEIVSVCEGR